MTSLFAKSAGLDPTLASLFASSAGPVQVPKSKSRAMISQEPVQVSERLSEASQDESSTSAASSVSSSESDESDKDVELSRSRKRRRVQEDDLEGAYFHRLAKDEEREELQRQRVIPLSLNQSQANVDDDDDSNSAAGDLPVPVHESLAVSDKDIETDKAQRTVFLSNVSVSAIKSKAARKELLNHLETASKSGGEDDHPSNIHSIRFRSTAYANDSGPKKAGYATKSLMEETTKSTNSYVVFKSSQAAKVAARELNGTIVLDRHIHASYLAAPAPVDHKRCVFIGNLNFVDQEKPPDDAGDDPKARRPKAKQPADAEEGLWRTFSKVGKVESVRVVRDKDTRVGKGFAYVQFADQNGVEAALLLNDKKFPPMLPRKLRVMRAKKLREKSARTDKPLAERRKLLGTGPGSKRSRPAKSDGRSARNRRERTSTGNFVFEGHRATKPSQKDKKIMKRKAAKSMTRSARRGAAFKEAGGKKSNSSM